MAGRSVRLFLVDGTPQGMRTAEVGNWTGLAIVCPRTDLGRLVKRPEAKRTGIYLLVGPSDTAPSGAKVYVGEADEVLVRLSQHDSGKDFWTHAVVFVSKDENLTKAHVRWLEAALVREIKEARRAELFNGNEPPAGRLPEADVADLETYLENVRLLLPTLGVHVLAAAPASTGAPAVPQGPRFEMHSEEAVAECVVAQGQFIVQQGSTARAKEQASISDSLLAIRRRLREAGVLVPVPGSASLLRFSQPYAFESPSTAAAMIAGVNTNGRNVWKLKGEGMTYREWEASQVGAPSVE